MLRASLLAVVSSLALSLSAEETVNLDAVTRIRDEGLNRSRASEILTEMCDSIGPRLTGSPNFRKASEWARAKFADWGLANVHAEAFPFGRGWAQKRSVVRMLAPEVVPVPAIPRAWTPGTQGPKAGKAIYAPFDAFDDRANPDEYIEKWKGKLENAIVLKTYKKDPVPHEKADVSRYTSNSLEEIGRFEIGPGPWSFPPEKALRIIAAAKKLNDFYKSEKVLGLVDGSRFDHGTIGVAGTFWHKVDDPVPPPTVVIPLESFGRIVRLLDRKTNVELEIDVETEATEPDAAAAVNTIAEIQGTDQAKKDEFVVIGAHFDSWHGGTGATDNGAGVAVVMEAARILKVVGLRLGRTIRLALWGGEEQGLLGSWDYVQKHLGARSESTEPEQQKLPPYGRKYLGPLRPKAEHGKVSVYFNLDNGAGKIRGVYAQENAAVVPIFEAWLTPFHDLGATTVTMRNTAGTDHLSFDAVGIPGFQFIQDGLDLVTRTHHSNMDTIEHAPASDLAQASTVLAAFAYFAAAREEMLPRKPIPPDEPIEGKAPRRP